MYRSICSALLFLEPLNVVGIVHLESFGKFDIVEPLLLVRIWADEKTIDLTKDRVARDQ